MSALGLGVHALGHSDFYGYKYEHYLRHEVAHCNNWRGHDGRALGTR